MSLFEIFFLWLARNFSPPVKATDESHSPSVPDLTTEIVKPVITAPTLNRPYMTAAMVALLAAIREHESGKPGYDADYRNDDRFGDLSRFTFDEAYNLGRRQVSVQHEASSAIGGYQFLSKTLASLKASLSLTGKEPFTHAMQDDLAVALMVRRGYAKYMKHEINRDTFCNNLAMEWASLPVVNTIKGAHRMLKAGQSYYAGDGLNAAGHKPAKIQALVAALLNEPGE